MTHHRALRIAGVLTSVAALAGCAIGGAERVGGDPAAETSVVTMVSPFGNSEHSELAHEVSRLSGGRLKLRVVATGHNGTDYEAATIKDVLDGRADLAMVGTRAWAEFGAPGISAVGAPFLVDSYALQERVLTSDLVETMLAELPSGLAGIGILPGPLRRPLGKAHVLATPRDFRDLVIGTQQSDGADDTMRALGARPERLQRDVGPSSGTAGLDGLELSVAGIESGRLDTDGSHVMTNVNFWPRPLVVFAAEHALSDDQLHLLREAAANVVTARTTSERHLEEETAANLCRKNHATFDVASPQDLEALKTAVDPVYAELERDAGAAKVIKRIEQLKDALGEPPTEIPACSPVPDPRRTVVATKLDGVWVMDTDRSASMPDYLDENWGHWVFAFDHGRFAITQENETSCTWGYGSFAVNGSRTEWTFKDGGGIAPNTATNRPGEYFVFDVSTYRDTLTLTPVEGEISPLNFRAQPWRRLGQTASTEHFSTRCPPPAAALNH